MKAPTVNDAITGIYLVCALAIAGTLVRREFFARPLASAPVEVQRRIVNWRDYRSGQPLGAVGRPVSLVVFSDYECPACRVLSARLDTVRAKYGSQVSIYYRNVPLPYHRRARPAAFAAECAARAGRFEHAYKLLFANVDSIGVRSWGRFASLAGVADTVAFGACVRDSLPANVVARDESDARRLGVRATPTLLINDLLFVGAPASAELAAMLDEAMKANLAAR